MKPHLAHIATF